MNHYIDIKIKADKEFSLPELRNKAYTKLHKAIFDLKAHDIGVSFPKKEEQLGDTIRIHATQKRLAELQNKDWLGGLAGYCKTSEVLPVPDKIQGYQVIMRTRQTMTETKLKNRLEHQKKNGILDTDEKVWEYTKQYRAKMLQTGLNNPYLELQSTSTEQKRYRVYIGFEALQQQPKKGEFNRFGLSKTATVPIF